jgi:hypothetical protein
LLFQAAVCLPCRELLTYGKFQVSNTAAVVYKSFSKGSRALCQVLQQLSSPLTPFDLSSGLYPLKISWTKKYYAIMSSSLSFYSKFSTNQYSSSLPHVFVILA